MKRCLVWMLYKFISSFDSNLIYKQVQTILLWLNLIVQSRSEVVWVRKWKVYFYNVYPILVFQQTLRVCSGYPTRAHFREIEKWGSGLVWLYLYIFNLKMVSARVSKFLVGMAKIWWINVLKGCEGVSRSWRLEELVDRD